MRLAKHTSCSFRGCDGRAQYRPVLLIPVADGAAATALQVDLGIAVCARHRLPRRWDLARQDRRLARALEHLSVSPARLHLAWIEHLALE